MAEPTIDRATIEALKETTGADFVAELVDTFLAEVPGMLAELRRGLETGNAEAFRRAAHSLKSNCNTLGALPMGVIARDLELGGLDKACASATPLAALEAEYARVASALKALRDA